jgi:hypothetical protein
MQNVYKVYYRFKGKVDNAWVNADDELGAKAALLERYPTATPTKVVLMKEGDLVKDERPLAEVIRVDFKARKRVA